MLFCRNGAVCDAQCGQTAQELGCDKDQEDSCPDFEHLTMITSSPDSRGFQDSEVLVCGALEGTPCQAGCVCLALSTSSRLTISGSCRLALIHNLSGEGKCIAALRANKKEVNGDQEGY
eukprot:1154561-Pelagomonas_calceolata.AAC.7